MNTQKPVTIHDVAKRAGVSLSTVSRVLNASTVVNAQTRAKVAAAVRELNYAKTRSVSMKPARLTKMVGLIIPDILNPFFPLLIKGIEHVSKIHSYHLILCDSENDVALEQQHINNLYDNGIDGIIMIPSSGTVHIEKFLRQGIPFVFLDRFIEMDDVSYVVSDNEEGAYQAVKYLLKLGHREIISLTGPRNLSTEQARIKGCQRALAEEGIEGREDRCICANYELEEAYTKISGLLHERRDFTAIFATNDMMAFGAKQALEEHGLQIPDDISLIGYDDIRFSALIALTSVAQPTYEMGKSAMVLLIDLINQRITPPQHVMLRPSMVIRGSCKRR